MLNPKNLSDRVKHVSFNTKRDVDKNIENKLQYLVRVNLKSMEVGKVHFLGGK